MMSLAVAFILNAGVLGLRYVFKGFPFKAPKILDSRVTSEA